MPRPSFSQLPIERRQQILSVAADEFARSGFEGTSYNKLLERLGLGKSSAYYYFENKRDLFLAVVVDCYSTYFARLASGPVPGTVDEFWTMVLDSAVSGFEFILSDPHASAVMRCMQRDPALLAELSSDQVLSGIASFYADTLRLGQALGAVRTDLPLDMLVDTSRALALALDQWFVRSAAGGIVPDSRLTAERYLDLTRRMLEPASSSEPLSRKTGNLLPLC